MEEKKDKGGYGRYLKGARIGLSPLVWIVLSIAIAVFLSLSLLILLPSRPGVSIVVVITLPTLIIGLPIIMKERRDIKIEEAVPDVFEELATSLRAGATIEQALLDLTKIQKGPLIDELKIALNDMEGGFSFEESLENLISRVDVPLLKRVFKIVVDGRRAGGELAEILEAVAGDAREMARLQRERVSKTLMYVIFIFAAGAIVAPIIFGFVSQIGSVIVNITKGGHGTAASPLDLSLGGITINLLWIYTMIECFISGIMLAFVRGARIWKGIIFYSLSMALIATVVFEVSRMLASNMLPTGV